MKALLLPHSISPGVLPLFALTLTIGAYLFGVTVQQRVKSAVANPVLIAIVIIGIVLRLLHLSYRDYFSGAQLIHFLLGPATVALAIPLVRSLEQMRRSLVPMAIALPAGALVGMVSGYACVRLLGGSRLIAVSMLPKCVTTPIAIGVTQRIGGDTSLAAVFAIAGGILVATSIDAVLGWMRVDDASARGLAAGTAGSGIGASHVIAQGPVSAAFAGVAIGANGFITAALAPFLGLVLRHW